MNDDRSFERRVADSVAGIGSVPMSDDFYDDIHTYASRHRQRPAWLALIKEPPMRSNSRLAVGSPTVRVAAIMVATLLLAMLVAGAGIAGQRLLAADDDAIVVAADGSGDYTTISEAVAAAVDGDEIHIRPGVYLESILIEEVDVLLKGDGLRNEIVIEAPEDGLISPIMDGRPFGIAVVDSDSEISGLTLRGQRSQLHVSGGAPMMTKLTLEGVGDVFTGNETAHDSVSLHGGTRATFADSEVIAGGSVAIHGLAEPLITGNVLSGGTNVYVNEPGDGARFENNQILDAASRAIGIWGSGSVTIKGNTIKGAAEEGISDSGRSSALIEDNTIEGTTMGIELATGSEATVAGNAITNSSLAGIAVTGASPELSDNTVADSLNGLTIMSGGSPTITGNEISATRNGMIIGQGTSPIVDGNTICGGEVGVEIWPGAEPQMGENEICEPGPNG